MSDIVCSSTTTTWEPRDEVKGDVARIIFYMATRYMGDPGEPSLNIVDYINNSSDPLMGKLSTLLQWNEQDPVDAFERRRNQVILLTRCAHSRHVNNIGSRCESIMCGL